LPLPYDYEMGAVQAFEGTAYHEICASQEFEIGAVSLICITLLL